MSNWLSLVIGVIIGLIFGWLIDLFWRRRQEMAASIEGAVEPTRTVERPILPPVPVVEPPASAEAAPVELTGAPTVEAEIPPVGEAAGIVESAALPSVEVEAPPVGEVAAKIEAEALGVDLGEVELGEVERKTAGGVDWPEISERVAQVGEELQETVAEVRAEISELPEKAERFVSGALDALAPAPAEEPRALVKDDLLRIEGIGRVYAGRLAAAGINTFADLVAAGEARLQEIIQPQAWQRVNFAEWIEQARLIVEGNEEELRVLQEKLFRRKKG